MMRKDKIPRTKHIDAVAIVRADMQISILTRVPALNFSNEN